MINQSKKTKIAIIYNIIIVVVSSNNGKFEKLN